MLRLLAPRSAARRAASLLLALSAAVAAAQAPAGPINVELILDASGSMFNRLDDGRYRIVAAKEVLADLIAGLPEHHELNVGLRVYGSSMRATAEGACEDTVLKVPVDGFARHELLDTVKGTQALGATPIALSLEQAAQDFPTAGRNVIVLITDGIESCRSDLREVAHRVRDQGIDLRIVGFDLDDSAVRGFDGLGTFENARSAAELLAAVTRAVEVRAEVDTYPVTVTLTREGDPATEGAAVTFVGAIDGEVHPFSSGRAGEFDLTLPAGSYTAMVSDAFSAEPLVVAGLVVTAAGPNAMAFELAPLHEVTLSVADAAHPAGSVIVVSYRGAPPGYGSVTVAPGDADDYLWWSSADTEPGGSGTGSVELLLPDVAGEYELRYHVDLPEGGRKVIGRLAVLAEAVEAGLDAPDEAGAGSVLEVAWTGPANPHDYIAVVAVGAAEGTWLWYSDVAHGSPVRLQLPDAAGTYEVRYVTGGSGRTLAAMPVAVVASEATLSAVGTVRAGSVITLHWTGPDNPDDFITIVEAGADDGSWSSWSYPGAGGVMELRVPDYEGDYEVRYVTGTDGLTLARLPVTITPASASLEAPDSVQTDAVILVTWQGPDDPDDFLTIVPAGADEGSWATWADVVPGPVELYAPSEPGAYEIRYVTGQAQRTLASLPLTVR